MTETCAHCGGPIEKKNRSWLHTSGYARQMHRCQNPLKPYGYEAHPVGTDCEYPCMGTYRPDPDLVLEAVR